MKALLHLDPANSPLSAGMLGRMSDLAAASRLGDGPGFLAPKPNRVFSSAYYSTLAPHWAIMNQRVVATFGLVSDFARYLREQTYLIGTDTARYDNLISNQSMATDRNPRLHRLIAEAINGYPVRHEGSRTSEGAPLWAYAVERRKDEFGQFTPGEMEFRPTDDLVESIYRHAFGWGPLEPFIADQTVTEIMVDGPDRIFTERAAISGSSMVRERSTRFESREVYFNFVENLVERMLKHVGRDEPTVDLSLPDGSRVHVAFPPVVVTPAINIRKFPTRYYTMSNLEDREMFSHAMRERMELYSNIGANIIFYGGTGSGKTTLMIALLNSKPESARLVTIEDTAEIRIDERAHPNSVPMLTSEKRNMQQLVRDSLRMRPTHLIIGETRDETAIDLIRALNSGITGSLSTVHATTSESALVTLTNLVRQAPNPPTEEPARRMVAKAVHVLVQIAQLEDGTRRVMAIDEVDDVDEARNFAFQIRNVFYTEIIRSGRDKRALEVRFKSNPQYKMTTYMREIFEHAGLDPKDYEVTA
jgi:Flp pilus assembly CpaF family ATPase